MSKKLTFAVSGILAASVAAASLGMSSGRAADECLRGPKGSAPEGSHWYYRVDRSTGRHCWYLGAKGAKVRQTSSRSSSRKRPAPPPAEKATPAAKIEPAAKAAAPAIEPATPPADPAPPPARSRAATVNELPVANAPVATRFSQFWPSLRAPIDIAQQPTAPVSPNNYVEEPAPALADAQVKQDEIPPAWPVATEAKRPAASVITPAPVVIKNEQMLAIMIGALSLAGLIMALTYKIATIRHRRPSGARWDIAANEARLQLQPFSHTAAPARLPAPAPVRKPVAAKRAIDPDRETRETHEARRLRELRELRETLETRLEELRHARRRSAA